MPTQLTTPTITAEVMDRVKIRISGLSVANASSYQLRWGTLSGGGRIDTIQADTNGTYTLEDCRCRTTYFLSARALGDDETYTNSDWSDEISIVTGQVVDASIAAPNITLGINGFVTMGIEGLLLDRSYRYQLSIDPLTLDSQPPKITGAGTGAQGNGRIQGLRPNTTYYIRFSSTHPHGKCSLWSDVLTFTTVATTSTVQVTNTNDSGEGSLRAALESPNYTLITFAPELNGKTISLESGLTTRWTLTIDASALPDGITIDFGGEAGRTLVAFAVSWRGVTFKNLLVTATNTYAINGGMFIDCRFVNCTLETNYAIVYNASLSGCAFIGCSTTSTGVIVSNCWIADTLIDGATGRALYQCAAMNVVFVNSYLIYALSNCRATNCVIYGNSGNTSSMAINGGTAYECDVVGNQIEIASAPNTGQVCTGTLYDCRVENNRSNGNYAPAFNAGYLYDCVFKDNTGKLGNGVGNGYFYRCKIIETDRTRQMTYGNSMYFTDCLLVGGNVTGGVHNNNTVLKMSGAGSAVNNCLLGPGSINPSSASCVLHWDNTPTSLLYAGKVFLDAANGDYRLCIDSPAIGAGSVDYVSEGDTDLNGNPRLTNNTVACGCYEFAAYQLEPPSYTLNILPGGQATISYTLPEYSSAFCFQYSANQDFTDAHEITSDTSTFDLTGLSGFLYIRTKAVGISGKTLDSDWTPTDDIYVDTIAPVVLVDSTPITMTYGETVNFLDGVTFTDDSPGPISLSYTLYDWQSHLVEIDGQTVDVPSSRVPKGNYRLKITATDTFENEGTAERELSILPPKLQPPTITLKSIQGNTAIISGLLDSGAVGWILSVDGEESVVTPNQGGQIPITALAEGTHLVKVKAKGDFINPDPPEQPTGDFRDSEWSNTLSVTIGGDTPADAPVLSQKAITDHTLTLEVSGIGDEMSYIEIILATDPRFSSPAIVSKVPKAEIVIEGLKASQIYFVRARGYYGTEPTGVSPTLVVETEAIRGTSPADKLAYIRARIALLRDYLAESANLSTISIDGISETRVDRSTLRAELEALEAEESRLTSGGGRLRTIDARWVI